MYPFIEEMRRSNPRKAGESMKHLLIEVADAIATCIARLVRGAVSTADTPASLMAASCSPDQWSATQMTGVVLQSGNVVCHRTNFNILRCPSPSRVSQRIRSNPFSPCWSWSIA